MELGGRGRDLLAKALKTSVDGRVEHHVSDLKDEATDDRVVDLARQFDLAAGLLLHARTDLVDRLLRQVDGTGDRDRQELVVLGPEDLVPVANARERRQAVTFSASSLRKLTNSGSASLTMRSRPSAFSWPEKYGEKRNELQLVVAFDRVGELLELRLDRIDLVAAFAASNSDVA